LTEAKRSVREFSTNLLCPHIMVQGAPWQVHVYVGSWVLMVQTHSKIDPCKQTNLVFQGGSRFGSIGLGMP
jgi:hypothetical protein